VQSRAFPIHKLFWIPLFVGSDVRLRVFAYLSTTNKHVESYLWRAAVTKVLQKAPLLK